MSDSGAPSSSRGAGSSRRPERPMLVIPGSGQAHESSTATSATSAGWYQLPVASTSSSIHLANESQADLVQRASLGDPFLPGAASSSAILVPASPAGSDDSVSPLGHAQLHRRNSSRVRAAHDELTAALEGARSSAVSPRSPTKPNGVALGDTFNVRTLPSVPSTSYHDPFDRRGTPSLHQGPVRKASLRQTAAGVLRRASTRVVGQYSDGHSPVDRIDNLQRIETLDLDAADERETMPGSAQYSARPSSDFASRIPSRTASLKRVQGTSLGMLTSENPLRKFCLKVLRHPWTEAVILVLIVLMVVLLVVQSAPNVYTHPRPTIGYFDSWTSYLLFVIFCVFTIEVAMRIIALGFLFGPSTKRLYQEKPARPQNFQRLDSQEDLTRFPPRPPPEVDPERAPRSVGAFVFVAHKQNEDIEKPFLRKSWNRIDLVSVICFWISFALAETGLEAKHNLYFFRAVSVLRAMRLLAITEGTATILQSLKLAGPHLVNVGFFLIFAMILFSIIGTQSFAMSARRVCQWRDPAGVLANVTMEGQGCGGYVDAISGETLGYISSATGQPTSFAKGYICPPDSFCIEGENPHNGATSFDNIGASLMQVVIVASANTWTVVLYSMINAEYAAAAAFFIITLVVLQYWLINLFVAVITTTFGSIVDETKHSALAAEKLDAPSQAAATLSTSQNRPAQSETLLEKVLRKTTLLWVALVLVDLVFQASQYYGMSEARAQTISNAELAFTLVFDLEIVLRMIPFWRHWRGFFDSPRNVTDLVLALGSTIAQIPPVKTSGVGPWLTIFEVARFYRVILAIPAMRRLIMRVFGTVAGLTNVVFFILLLNFTVSLIAVQFLRGVADPNDSTQLNFSTIWISFLSTYQILSSENWTDVLYNVLSQTGTVQTVIAAIFLCGWMLCAFFILINLLIAVISESIVLSEAERARRQVEHYLSSQQRPAFPRWHRRYGSMSLDAATHQKEPTYEMLPSPLQAAFQDPQVLSSQSDTKLLQDAKRIASSLWAKLKRTSPKTGSQPNQDAADETIPTYEDKSLNMFGPTSRIRLFCQHLVDPSYGSQRLNGVKAISGRKYAFQTVIFLCIIASIVVAAVASPVYRQKTFIDNAGAQPRFTWYNLAEVGLGVIFILEAIIKIVADGLIFSPNAYLMSVWNLLDLLVLATIIVNIVTILVGYASASAFLRALKAFRALRLINLSSRIQRTFYDVFIAGIGVLFGAAVLCLLILVPFAVWGQQIFGNGLFFSCSDSSVSTQLKCAGEYLASAIGDWNFPQPRVWSNPHLPVFDNFGSSLLLLFELLSLEGWIDQMRAAIDITGSDNQPQNDAATYYAIFFVLFNIFGFIILAVFVTLLIDNATKRSGTALLTSEQRNWVDLKKMVSRQQPAKRPWQRPASALHAWCFERSIQKSGWWTRANTALLCLHILLLLTIATSNSASFDIGRNWAFLVLTVLFGLDVLVKLIGLGWTNFRSNYWNVYDTVVVVGAFFTTLVIAGGRQDEASTQLQKLFLTGIAFKLVQKNDSLNHLFKLAAASLPALANLFCLWIIVFLVWALLYLEIFGLSRIGPDGSWSMNYSSFGWAMLMLVLQSTGEGWNAIMHDYTNNRFPLCTESPSYLLTDCGSQVAAYLLFCSWNIISMYLFSNLVLSAVVENFSAVFTSNAGRFALDREQMRGFKRAWSEFDRDSTGYIAARDIAPFMARLRGAFDTRIWPSHLTIANLRREATSADDDSIDLRKLSIALSKIDYDELQVRKRRKNYLHHEALMKAHENADEKIAFRDMMLLVIHHCLIDDDKSLSVGELIDRKQELAKVREKVLEDRVVATIKSYVMRKRFEKLRAEAVAWSANVPAIVVERRATVSSS